mmetsp:Transcript_89723/g.171978  ORF Transcript_89723/g.171978 Transcript_89723/m.171978 type:complete len:179 (-) Transcript_89723:203-739(-)
MGARACKCWTNDTQDSVIKAAAIRSPTDPEAEAESTTKSTEPGDSIHSGMQTSIERPHLLGIGNQDDDERFSEVKVKAVDSAPLCGFQGVRDVNADEGSTWIVIGGAEEGGIVVSVGQSLTSPVVARLGTGALVEQIELKGERLHYKKVEGAGPEEGWVSISAEGTILLELEHVHEQW